MVVNTFDYYQNPEILSAIKTNVRHIKNSHDREDCSQEIFAELYSMMPLDTEDAISVVNKVAAKFKRDDLKINANELSFEELFID
jgi:hypothetical protein